MTTRLNDMKEWKALRGHHDAIETTHLRDLFRQDPGRADRMCAEGAGLFLDYSKNRVTDESLRLLTSLARACGLSRERDDAETRRLCAEARPTP